MFQNSNTRIKTNTVPESNLSNRITSLEKLVKFLAMLVILVPAITLWFGFTHYTHAQESMNVYQAKSFQVVNDSGEIIGEFGILGDEEGKPSLVIYDENGSPSISLNMDENLGSITARNIVVESKLGLGSVQIGDFDDWDTDDLGLIIRDPKGHSRLGCSLDEDEAVGFYITDTENNPRYIMGMDSDEMGGFVALNEDEKPFFMMGEIDEMPILFMLDEEGLPRYMLGIARGNQEFMALLNPDEEAVFIAPESPRNVHQQGEQEGMTLDDVMDILDILMLLGL